MRHTTETRSTKPSMMYRLTGGRRGHVTQKQVTETRGSAGTHHHAGHAGHSTHHSHHTSGTHAHHTTGPAHHHRRRPSLGDKVSGAWMKMKGSLLRRPGLKAAGTRRERGTDGRGSHRRANY